VLRISMLVLVLVVPVRPAAAQIAWDAPPLVSHVAPAGVSLYLLGPAGGDIGGLVTFRHSAGPVGLGYRFAAADESGTGDLAVAGGIDVSGFLARAVEGSELDVIWWSGAGVGIGDETVVSVPLGALVGWSGEGGDAILSPYAGGHLTLDVTTRDEDNVRFTGTVDLGLDLVLQTGWLVRFGASVGDREALALGVRIGS
jgi:hypothetical protein